MKFKVIKMLYSELFSELNKNRNGSSAEVRMTISSRSSFPIFNTPFTHFKAIRVPSYLMNFLGVKCSSFRTTYDMGAQIES